ncbi:hypothetical protein BKA67DRAFT_690327 [Truncatella angustata]|uniref:C3H1-type domain-containing protein n=1 Tax=Truncatella angustata TaxID=152316 RepID=A0A9P8UMS2_9PEZI|nr:uncharacterized protein BKA67DRAFT_690327 [Truncatella angustata]KAH6655544.1 hypothetical protein BKA67DRAFT_690327 [Truncatella angustata]
MDTSFSPIPAGPAMNPPSEVSYSSEASCASTRTTSSATSLQPSSPLADLQQFTTTSIETASNDLPDPKPNMERNAFESVNMRRGKLVAERGNEICTTTNASQFQRSLQQPQASRTGGSICSQASRSLTSNNWRTQHLIENAYGPFEPAGSSLNVQASRGISSYPVRPPSRMEQHAPLMAYPNMATFSDTQLDSSYAYCFDRGNGQYTRLIPADMLPPLQNIPALQQGCQGMIVMPMPRDFLSNGRPSSTEPVTLKTSPVTSTAPADNIQVSLSLRQRAPIGMNKASSNPGNCSDLPIHPASLTSSSAITAAAAPSNYNPLNPFQRKLSASLAANAPSFTPTQSRIDTIVASIPSTPTPHSHHGLTGSSLANNSKQGTSLLPCSAQHHQHQRRPKIYCDKWVHEGVCAFTQQGCKYKHEMPFDKVTQHQLGLFHGLPAWWKKQQAEIARQRDVPQSTSTEGLAEGNTSGVQSGLAMGESIGFGVNGQPSNVFGNASRENFGSSTTIGLGWKQQSDQELDKNNDNNDQVQDRISLSSGNITTVHVSAHDGCPSFRSSIWNPSPFGPIAPPQRTVIRPSLPPLGPPPSLMTGQATVNTKNPYASLDTIDCGKSETPPNSARLD